MHKIILIIQDKIPGKQSINPTEYILLFPRSLGKVFPQVAQATYEYA